MDLFSSPDFADHEQVVFVRDAGADLRAIIAVHDTRLGGRYALMRVPLAPEI